MKKLIGIPLIFISLTLGATKWYLSPTGDDDTGNGSIGTPWFTLEKVWGEASAGDTIYMRGGTYEYTETQTLSGLSGTDGNMVNVWAYFEETPVITKVEDGFTYSMAMRAGIYLVGDYIYMKGLEITGFEQEANANYFGLSAQNSSHCIFEKINSHHNGLGMHIAEYLGGTATGNLVLNCDFHHNYDPLTDPDIYGNGDGMSIGNIANSTSINTVRGCRFWNNSDDGFDCWNNEGIVYVDQCWAWHNGYREDSVTIGGDGNGIKLGVVTVGSETYMRYVTNCIAADNPDMGFTQNVWDNETKIPCKVYNNFAYSNGVGKGLGFQFSHSAQGTDVSIFRNNTGYLNYNNINISCKEWDVDDHNSWNGDVTINSNDFVSLDVDLLATARQSDGSLPDIDFAKLVEGSDLIDAGIYVGIAYRDDAPDMGPFEYGITPPIFAKDKSGNFMKDSSGNLMMIE